MSGSYSYIMLPLKSRSRLHISTSTISSPITILFNQNLFLAPIHQLIHIFILDPGLSSKSTPSLGQLLDTNLPLIPNLHVHLPSREFIRSRASFSITVSNTSPSGPALLTLSPQPHLAHLLDTVSAYKKSLAGPRSGRKMLKPRQARKGHIGTLTLLHRNHQS